MRVEVQYTPDCPNALPIIDLVRTVAATRPDVEMVLALVAYDETTPFGFAGSPTVLVDGVNPFKGTPAEAAACALQPPTLEQVGAILHAPLEGDPHGRL